MPCEEENCALHVFFPHPNWIFGKPTNHQAVQDLTPFVEALGVRQEGHEGSSMVEVV